MTIGVAEAARELGLSPARIRALIAAGDLAAERVGPVFVLDERAVDEFSRRERPQHVRAMAPRIAWAAAALADGQRPTWLRSDELSRLRARLSRNDTGPGTWRAQLNDIGTRTRFRAGPSQVDELLAHRSTVRSGTSATNLITDPLVSSIGATVWVRDADQAKDLRRSLGLLRSDSGNVSIAVPATPNLPTLSADGENAYRPIVAVDLLHETDPRAHSAATTLLETVAREARWVPPR